MAAIFKGILLGTAFIFYVQCHHEPTCGSSGICDRFPNHSLEGAKPRINQFLEHCTIGDQKADLQPVADWLQNESCVLSAEILQSCLYSIPAVCFIEIVFTDQERSIIAFSMTNPITVKGFE
ncbi:MAG: hypothetical protein IPL46_14100 [Saprospiraceae bacterium]|nr:hypothetical protein [Saprospiraceae bacterium]